MPSIARINGQQVALVGIVLASFLSTLCLAAYVLLHLPPAALEHVLSENFLTALAGVVTAFAGLIAALYGMARSVGLLHDAPPVRDDPPPKP